MPLEIIRNDIVNMKVDAIVNSANPDPVVGSGVDAAFIKKQAHLYGKPERKLALLNQAMRVLQKDII